MTKKIFILSVLIFTSFIYSTSVYAQKTLDECEKMEQTDDQKSRCFDRVKDLLDRELQTWVNNHVFNLEEKALVTGRRSALKMFKRSQNDFVTYRDNNCRWQYLAISPEKGAGLAFKKCYIITTQSRINELSMIP
jgi:uncharacterized protein YecT (DUF1311 family)